MPQPLRRLLRTLALLVSLAALVAGRSLAAAGADPGLSWVDAKAVLNRLSDGLAQGRQATVDHLRRLGFGEALAQTPEPPAGLGALSARSLLESLYGRAELAQPGEGKRFIAVLHADIARRSAALAGDPVFLPFSGYSTADLDQGVRPIRFAPPPSPSSPRPALSAAADAAIVKLASIYAGPGVASARGVLLRHLRKPGFGPGDIDRSILESASARDALELALARGTPPPTPESALRGVFVDILAGSAAMAMDAAMWAVIERLSEHLPPEHAAYASNEARLPSRQRQAETTGQPGARAPAQGAFAPEAANVEDVERSFGAWEASVRREPRAPGRAGAAEPRARPPSGGPRYVPPRRTGRKGIAMGNTVSVDGLPVPQTAWWVPNRKDDRFGRLFVVLAGSVGAPATLAASKVMFADSFYAAAALATTFPSDGGALKAHWRTLVTLDRDTLELLAKDAAFARPEADLAGWVGLEAAEQGVLADLVRLERARLPAQWAGKVADSLAAFSPGPPVPGVSPRQRFVAHWLTDPRWIDLPRAREHHLQAPLGLVIRPQLAHREIAWSLARADLWPMLTADLEVEARLAAGASVPAAPAPVPLGEVSTWFSYDRPATVSLRPDRLAWRLEVHAGGTDSSPRRMAAAAFARVRLGDARTARSAEPASLPEQESAMNPWLEWLGTHHHDFMRIEDLAHALALTRWLRARRVTMQALDIDGPGTALPTPRFYRWTTGPSVSR